MDMGIGDVDKMWTWTSRMCTADDVQAISSTETDLGAETETDLQSANTHGVTVLVANASRSIP